MKFSLWGQVLFLLPAGVFAQDEIPGFDICLASISGQSEHVVNVTAQPGYDNQPAFSADGGQLYYTRMEEDGQTEIWVYGLDSGEHSRLTHSSESEYSPTPVPDAAAITMVRVEADGKQRLWQLDLADNSATLLLPDIEPVGYHAWLGAERIALFLLPEPFTLLLSDKAGETTSVATHIGRSLHFNSHSGALLYVDQSQTPWRVMSLAVDGSERTALAELFPAQEDFTVSSSGTLWTGFESKLYKMPAGTTEWRLVADFEQSGISAISRIAINADETAVALVAAE
jgi:hypothetical protein